MFSTQEYEMSKIVSGTPKRILEILHNPDEFFRLNPLVVSVCADPTTPHSHTVVDKLTILGYFKTTISYTCASRFSEDGIEVDVKAGMGTKTHNIFKVKQGPDEETSEIYHRVVTTGLFFLMPYIGRTQREAHETLLHQLHLKLTNEN